MKTILVVCRGNITRSPFAEAVINRELVKRSLNKELIAISRGTQGTSIDPTPVKFPNISFYEDEFRFSKPVLDKFRVDIVNRISKPVDRKTAKEANLILAVDEINKVALLRLFPDLKTKIVKLSELIDKDQDFMDPEGLSGIESHTKILTEIHDTIINGFPKLLALVKISQKS